MRRVLAAIAAAMLMCAARAAPFADPTQPPAAFDGDIPVSPGLRVESILIAPDRRLAVISGQQVTIGSRIGSGAVVRISETEVVVRSADGEQTLKLFAELGRAAGPAKKGRAK